MEEEDVKGKEMSCAMYWLNYHVHLSHGGCAIYLAVIMHWSES